MVVVYTSVPEQLHGANDGTALGIATVGQGGSDGGQLENGHEAVVDGWVGEEAVEERLEEGRGEAWGGQFQEELRFGGGCRRHG